MAITGPKLERPIILANLLDAGLKTKPEEPALVLLHRTWSWRELDDDSTRLAKQYLGMGLERGDRVASLLPNRGVLIVHYLACCKAGLVATPLNYRYQAPEIDHALEVSGASLIVAHAEREEALSTSKYVPQLPLGRVYFDATNRDHPRLEELLTAGELATPLPPPPSPDAPVFIFFTSGSTGKPKGVTHSHATFGWMVASAVAALEITPGDVFMPATSASHVACSSLSFAGLAAGATVALARTFGTDELLPLVRRARPTLLCMLPAPLFALVRDHGATGKDFASLRRCVSGGDKISAELEHEYTALSGHAIEELYGMTETGTATYNPSGSGNRIGSIGQVAPGFMVSVRDDNGAEVLGGTSGKLWIKSPSNMVGYWNRPDATAETLVDGWLDTGDLVAADDEGYLWFRGRKKQIIIHDGSNICPQEVEDSLLEHPAVECAGVIGIHDLVHGENVRAYVTLRVEAPRPTMAALIQFSKARVGYKAPDVIIVLAEMPTTAVGKVDRVALKELAATAANQQVP
ncbi:MAG TPA: class I adenylate-forming enzyme family protein [Lacipirellulaceae bacterium]|nr:class I adenylate-forming enzyme family protein [Lacipirellulaceae bacterium]